MSKNRGGRRGKGDPAAGAADADTTALQMTDAEATTAALPLARSGRGPALGAGAARSGSSPLTAAAGWTDEAGPRPAATRVGPRAEPRGPRQGRRRARLALTRVDPWSVFVLSLIVSLFLGVVLLVAVSVLYALLDSLGVLSSVQGLVQELDPGSEGQPLFGLGRVLGVTAVIAAVDIVLLTVLATLGAFLYNLCAALTGGLDVTLTERD